MKTVCLQFQTLGELSEFLKKIQNINCEINRKQLTVLCEVSEKELQTAIYELGAQMIIQQ